MNVLAADKLAALKTCFDAGMGQRATERETGVSKNTVRYWWNLWRLDPDLLAQRERALKFTNYDKTGIKRGKYKRRCYT